MNPPTKVVNFTRHLLSLVAFCVMFAGTASAQSSYFNTPTSDVMPTGELYIEADLDARLSRFRDGGWQSVGFSSVYGLRKKTEVGLNAYFTRTADGFEPVELQPNVKYQFHNNEAHGTSLAAGAIAYIPIKRDFVSDSLAAFYVVGGKRFKGEWAPKVSGGAYQLVGMKRDSGDSRGLTFAVEQPLHRRVSLIVDWNTGKNRFGYAAVGLGTTITKRSYLYSAYYFGNEGRENNFLGVYYGMSF